MDEALEDLEMVLGMTDRFAEDEESGEELMPKHNQEDRSTDTAHQLSPAAGPSGLQPPVVSGPAVRKRITFEASEFSGEVRKRPRPTENLKFDCGGRDDYRRSAAADFWAYRERDFRLRDCEKEEFEATFMPKYTIETFEVMLVSNFGYTIQRDLHIFGMEPLCARGLGMVQKFLKIVRTTRILSVNTEGNRFEHPKLKDRDGRALPLVMVALCNLTGTVLFFTDSVQMPDDLREVLADVAITKIGSGLSREFEELERVGIRMRGWVESGALYRSFLLKQRRFGVEVQAEYLDGLPESKGLFPYVPYDWRWERDLKKGEPRRIPRASIPHIQMNVRVPLAVACAVVLSFAKDRRLSKEEFGFPILWESFDLVRGKAAEQLLLVSDNPADNWIARKPSNPDPDRHMHLNDAREMTFLRRAQADFVEVYEPFYNVSLKASEPYRMYADPEGEGLRIPAGNFARIGRFRGYFASLCGNCGSRGHRIKTCSRPFTPCTYNHDGATRLPLHSLRLCPILHLYCGLCFNRGHHESAHEIRHFTQRELRQRFLMNQPVGILTSVLLLTARPKGLEDLVMSHWRFGLLGQSFERDCISRFYLRIPMGKKLGIDFGQRRGNAQVQSRMITRKIEAAKHNADMIDPSQADPIPRYLLVAEHRRALLEERHQTRTTEKSASRWERHQPDPAEKSARNWSPQLIQPAEKSSWSWSQRRVVLQTEETERPEEFDWSQVRGQRAGEEGHLEDDFAETGGAEVTGWEPPDDDEDFVTQWIEEVSVESDEDWSEPRGKKSRFWKP